MTTGGTAPPAFPSPDTPGQLQMPQPLGAQPQPAPIEPEKPAAVFMLKAENCFATSELSQAGQLTAVFRLITSFSKKAPHL